MTNREEDLENHVSKAGGVEPLAPRSSTAVLQMLIDTRKLIEREEDWCNRDPGMNVTAPPFCAFRALECASGFNSEADLRVLMAFKDANGFSMSGEWNDESTHAEILAALDKAIEAERAKTGAQP